MFYCFLFFLVPCVAVIRRRIDPQELCQNWEPTIPGVRNVGCEFSTRFECVFLRCPVADDLTARTTMGQGIDLQNNYESASTDSYGMYRDDPSGMATYGGGGDGGGGMNVKGKKSTSRGQKKPCNFIDKDSDQVLCTFNAVYDKVNMPYTITYSSGIDQLLGARDDRVGVNTARAANKFF